MRRFGEILYPFVLIGCMVVGHHAIWYGHPVTALACGVVGLSAIFIKHKYSG